MTSSRLAPWTPPGEKFESTPVEEDVPDADKKDQGQSRGNVQAQARRTKTEAKPDEDENWWDKPVERAGGRRTTGRRERALQGSPSPGPEKRKPTKRLAPRPANPTARADAASAIDGPPGANAAGPHRECRRRPPERRGGAGLAQRLRAVCPRPGRRPPPTADAAELQEPANKLRPTRIAASRRTPGKCWPIRPRSRRWKWLSGCVLGRDRHRPHRTSRNPAETNRPASRSTEQRRLDRTPSTCNPAASWPARCPLGSDPRERAQFYQLPPRLREPLLEGMQERGPEGYQPMIDAYFRELSKEIK